MREFSRSVGKAEQAWEKRSEGFPRYASCAANVGTATIGDEIRWNRNNGATNEAVLVGIGEKIRVGGNRRKPKGETVEIRKRRGQ